jgi:hypothetical protein
MSHFKSLICALGIILVASNVGAQEITGSLRGTVLHPSGAVVRGAAVSAKHLETGLTRAITTDHQGDYVLVELPVGHYHLEVTAKDFEKYVQEGISLDVNETAIVPVHLVVGLASQQVQVRADAELIQSSVSSLGQTVMEREIPDLPLNGRKFAQLEFFIRASCRVTPRMPLARHSGVRHSQCT